MHGDQVLGRGIESATVYIGEGFGIRGAEAKEPGALGCGRKPKRHGWFASDGMGGDKGS